MDKQDALQAALSQIAYYFGDRDSLTPEQRAPIARGRLERIATWRHKLVEAANAEMQLPPDDRGFATVDPYTAWVIAWYLRREAYSDNVAADGFDALRDAADDIERGEVCASPRAMLDDLDREIAELMQEAGLTTA